MDRIDETKHFSRDKTELAKELEAMYAVISERLNFLLDRISLNYNEIIHPDNTGAEQDGNFRWLINSSGNVVAQFRVSGTWTTVRTTKGP